MKAKIQLQRSPRPAKKWRAIFTTPYGTHHVDFGSSSHEDFTIHRDQQRKANYLNRFNKLIKKFENDPIAPITLSTMILWNKPTIEASLADYKKKFGFH